MLLLPLCKADFSPENESLRSWAVLGTLERNKHSFRPKQSSESESMKESAIATLDTIAKDETQSGATPVLETDNKESFAFKTSCIVSYRWFSIFKKVISMFCYQTESLPYFSLCPGILPSASRSV